MSFFDRKEEVVFIELTDYGKKKLSEGEFQPHSYEFYDDDIIYDYEYAGVTESQKESGDRIKTSPRLKNTFDLSDYRPLGNSDLNSQNIPAWEINFLSGELTSSVPNLSGSHGILNIPQLNTEIKFKTRVRQGLYDSTAGGYKPEGHDYEGEFDAVFGQNFVSKTFPDGTYIEVDGEFSMLEIGELNSIFENDNFEIEVFLEEEKENTGEADPVIARKQLFFAEEGTEPTNENVEYYLDVLVDDEIDDRIYCDVFEIRPGDNTNVFIKDEFECDIKDTIVTEDDFVYGDFENDDEDPC